MDSDRLYHNKSVSIVVVVCRVEAEEVYFSSVSLNDFNVICTLGMGGYSRVELVRDNADKMRSHLSY